MPLSSGGRLLADADAVSGGSNPGAQVVDAGAAAGGSGRADGAGRGGAQGHTGRPAPGPSPTRLARLAGGRGHRRERLPLPVRFHVGVLSGILDVLY